MIVKSNQICVVKDKVDRSFVYHKLYNNPRILDASITSLLDFFTTPKSREDINAEFEGDVDEVLDELLRLGFLCNADVPERKALKLSQRTFLLKVERGANLSRLELAISNACNLACPHCMHFANNDLPKQASKLNMSVETAKRCIDTFVAKVREQGNKLVRIHFGNGEPLMNWKTISFVLTYCASMPDIEFSYAINTNLTLLTREIAETLKEHRVKISTSLDGTKIGNDLVRIDRQGKGTFDRIVDKFKLLREIGYPVDGFSITVTDRNFEHLDESVIDLAKSMGVKEVSMDYDLVSAIQVPIADRVRKILSLRSYAQKLGIHFYGNWETPFKIMMSSSWLRTPHAYCPAVEGTTLEFNVDGSIRTCGHTNTIVDKNGDVENVLKPGSDYMSLIEGRLPGNNKMCVGCEIEGACAGQCHVTIESTSRESDLMQNMCDFMRGATVGLINEYMAANP